MLWCLSLRRTGMMETSVTTVFDRPRPGGAQLWKTLRRLPSLGQRSTTSPSLWHKCAWGRDGQVRLHINGLYRLFPAVHLVNRLRWAPRSGRLIWRQRFRSICLLWFQVPATKRRASTTITATRTLRITTAWFKLWLSWPASLHGSQTVQGEWSEPPAALQNFH